MKSPALLRLIGVIRRSELFECETETVVQAAIEQHNATARLDPLQADRDATGRAEYIEWYMVHDVNELHAWDKDVGAGREWVSDDDDAD